MQRYELAQQFSSPEKYRPEPDVLKWTPPKVTGLTDYEIRKLMEPDRLKVFEPELNLPNVTLPPRVTNLMVDNYGNPKPLVRWVPCLRPVVGTCTVCGHRGIIKDPEICLYRNDVL